MKRRKFLNLFGVAPIAASIPFMLSTKIASKPPQSILIEAHRGNSVDAPENTLVAIEQAIDIGVDRMEIDLQLSRDNKPVVIHDHTVDRTTDENGKVSDMTYKELKKLDAGSWKSDKFKDAKIPLLSEVMELCKGKAMVNIDLKNTKAALYMVRIIKDLKMEDDVVITGKIPQCTEIIREEGANLTMFYESTPEFSALLSENKYDQAINFAIKDARIYALPGFIFHAKWMKPEIVHQAHLHGLAVNVYAVNTIETLKEMIAANVDSIMTDDPAKMKRILNN